MDNSHKGLSDYQFRYKISSETYIRKKSGEYLWKFAQKNITDTLL